LFKGHIGIINAFKVKERKRKTVLNRGIPMTNMAKKLRERLKEERIFIVIPFSI
jgi:hypothetical protein